MKKALTFFVNIFKKNLLLKVVSIFVAVFVWFYVMSDTNPIRTVGVDNVTVGTVGSEELSAKGLALVGEDLTALANARVLVNVGQQNIDSVTGSSVTAVIDLTSINAPGEYEIEVDASSPINSTVIGVTPSTVAVEVESLMTRDLPVVIEETGEAQQGYYVAPPTISPNLVTVTGLASVIEDASKAICNIDLSVYTQSVSESKMLTIVDDEGRELDPSAFRNTLPSVILDVDVFETRSLPIDEQSAIASVTNVAEGYEVTGIEISPDNVLIAGRDIDGVDVANINTIDAGGATDDITVTAELSEISSGIFLPGSSVTVTVFIDEIVETQQFADIPVDIVGARTGYEYDMEIESVSVAVTGTLSELAVLSEENIKASINVQDLTASTYNMRIDVDVTSGGIAAEDIVVNPIVTQLTVRIG